MKSRFDLYGWREGDLRSLANEISQALGIKLILHDSSFWGVYFKNEGFEDNIKLVQNVEPGQELGQENELIEEKFPQFKFLLYVNEKTGEYEHSLKNLPGTELLKSETLD